MLKLGANVRLGAVGGLDLFVTASVPTVPSIREVPSARRRFTDCVALPLIALVTAHSVLFAVQKMWHRQRVGNVRRRHKNRMDQLRSAVNANMGFHPEIPLFSLRRSMHLGISLAILVLCRTRVRR